MAKVKSLSINPVSGSDSDFYATWELEENSQTYYTAPQLTVGSIVTINNGALGYYGVEMWSEVFNHQWYVYAIGCGVSDDYVVLNTSTDGWDGLMSPFHASDLTVQGQGESHSGGVTYSTLDHYEYLWKYQTGDSVWWDADSGSVSQPEEGWPKVTYSVPDNAVKIWIRVKPVSKTYTSGDSTVNYFESEWTTCSKSMSASFELPTPSVPTVTQDKYKLTLSNTVGNQETDIKNSKVSKVYYELYNASTSSLVAVNKASLSLASASWSTELSPGITYKARCCYCMTVSNKDYMGYYSEYTDEIKTIPSTPDGFTDIYATGEEGSEVADQVVLTWNAVDTAKTYSIEYASKKSYFDVTDNTTTISNIEGLTYTVDGLSDGGEYFFRLRASNDLGDSGWSGLSSCICGAVPEAPTTWSSTTIAVADETVTLYWVHNSEDNSSQKLAELVLTLNGEELQHFTVFNTTDYKTRDKTSYVQIKYLTTPDVELDGMYLVWRSSSSGDYSKWLIRQQDGTTIKEGGVLLWKVRTQGIYPYYGDYSIQREVRFYAKPSVKASLKDYSGNAITTVTTFPFYIYALPSPDTQTPIGYHVSVKSNNSYETIDQLGNPKLINADEIIFNKYYDITTYLMLEMTPDLIDLADGQDYTLTVTVSMDSGLSAEDSYEFNVSWDESAPLPDAEINIDQQTYTAYIRPYCRDKDGNFIQNISLSVYRRDYDGKFTEIASGLDNERNIFVTDPHPSLNYARYRIIAMSTTTGAIRYYDTPSRPVGCHSVVIQWDEMWTNINSIEGESVVERPWSGSMLEIPYNIDVSDSYDMDVSTVEYIGRSHPVSYYGTQLGVTSSWAVEIPKSDADTLYAIRRLSIYLGDVYVREPSGSGYWANISVSFSQKHCELTIPITFSIKRVEGGM